MNVLATQIAALVLVLFSTLAADARTVISLDGTWQIAEGSMAQPPAEYDHTVLVPGLADMASPPFESPGATVSSADRGKPWLRPADPRREAFWYRRTFQFDGPLPAVVLLKVHKARYGTKVLVNGQTVGEHDPCFTPGWFDVRKFLKGDGAENELIIRVGASMAQIPLYLNDGWDNEKSRYIPGIFDSVELIFSGTPHVVNVQTVPSIDPPAVRVVVELANAGAALDTKLKATVRESQSGRVAGETTAEVAVPAADTTKTVVLTVPVPTPSFGRPRIRSCTNWPWTPAPMCIALGSGCAPSKPIR